MAKYIEIKAESSHAHGKGCIGCKNHKRDIMLSFLQKESGVFYDVFLTQDDAEQFYKRLGKVIKSNKANP